MPSAAGASRASSSPNTPSSSAGETARASRWHACTSWNSGRANSRPSEREQPRERGHEHRPAAELLGEPGGVHRPGAAVGDQRELARVAALLGRDRAQRAVHARVRELVDRRRRPRAASAPSGSATRGDRLLGELGRDRDLPVGDRARRHQPEDDVRVGDRRVLAAAPVAGRPRRRRPRCAGRPAARPPRRATRSSRRPRRPRRCRSSGSAAARPRRASGGCRPTASRRPRTRGRARRRRPRSATPWRSCRPCRTRSRSR